MKKLTLIIERYRIGEVLLCLFMFFMVFNIRIVNLVLVALFLISIIKYDKFKQVIFQFYAENRRVVFLFIFFVIFQLYTAFSHQDIGDRRVGLLLLSGLVPFILYLSNNFLLLLRFFLISLTALILSGGYNLINYYLTSETFILTAGGHIDELLVVARPFLSYMLALGIFICFFLRKEDIKYRYIYMVLPFLFLTYMIFIGNRIQVLSLFLLLILYCVFYLRVRWFYKIGGILATMLLFVGMVSTSNTMRDRLELRSFRSNDIVKSLSHKEPRIEIWNCATEIIKENTFNHLTGIGSKKVLESKMENCYEYGIEDNPMQQYFIDSLFDTHNQFLEYYVLSGVLGCISFIFLFGVVFYKTIKYFIPTAILILVFNFCFVENLMDTQLGVYCFGFSFFLIFSILKKID